MRKRPGPAAHATRRREIGPMGTAGRIVGGVLLIAVAIAREDSLRPWDLAFAVSALPLLAGLIAALTRAVYRRVAPRALTGGRAAWSPLSATVLVLVLGIATALTFVTPADEPAIWMFLGISMLVAGARGEGGCEVVAVGNAVVGRDDRIGCLLYGPIDAAEARRRSYRRPASGTGEGKSGSTSRALASSRRRA